MDTLKKWMLFFYGTTPSVVSHHTEQAKMVAYTLGGIIAFITLPFILAGTIFLSSYYISTDVIDGPLRWLAILGIASVLTFGIVWMERALVILGDAVSQHIAPQIMLLGVRIGMICLLSVVVAEKWELAFHRGLIRAEKLEMRDEEITKHQKKSNQEFNVDGINQQASTTQSSITHLENQLNKLPEHLQKAQAKVFACQLDSKKIWLELQNFPKVSDRTEAQLAQATSIKIRANLKSTECKQLDRSTQDEVAAYKKPLHAQLNSERQEIAKLSSERSTATQQSKSSYTSRMQEADQARNDAGTDAKAFGRIRAKNPEIDHSVLMKTLLLAGIELLPLLLKLLLRNSPISAETRSVLQVESAKYRDQTKQSVLLENVGRGTLPTTRFQVYTWPQAVKQIGHQVFQKVPNQGSATSSPSKSKMPVHPMVQQQGLPTGYARP